jgi:hypothetical protein
VLVATSLAAFVGARRAVRPGQPLAAYALGDDKAAAPAILLPYRPPAALCVVGPKPPLCFFVEPQPASFRHRTSSAESLLLLILDLRGPSPSPILKEPKAAIFRAHRRPLYVISSSQISEWPKRDAAWHGGASHSEQCPTPRGHCPFGSVRCRLRTRETAAAEKNDVDEIVCRLQGTS